MIPLAVAMLPAITPAPLIAKAMPSGLAGVVASKATGAAEFAQKQGLEPSGSGGIASS